MDGHLHVYMCRSFFFFIGGGGGGGGGGAFIYICPPSGGCATTPLVPQPRVHVFIKVEMEIKNKSLNCAISLYP